MKKKRIIMLLIQLIIMLSLVFITLDWLRYFYPADQVFRIQAALSRNLKLTVSLTTLIMVWIAARESIGRDDNILLRLIFIFILAGDASVLYGITLPGICLFVAVQVLLILRNGSGFTEFMKSGRWTQHKTWIAACACGIVILVAFVDAVILRRFLAGTPLFPAIVAYSIILGLSLFVAWMTWPAKFFDTANSRLIIAGMTFFFACDITVGIDIGVAHGTVKTIASSLTWMFYSPALVLLCLSGYDIKKILPDK